MGIAARVPQNLYCAYCVGSTKENLRANWDSPKNKVIMKSNHKFFQQENLKTIKFREIIHKRENAQAFSQKIMALKTE